jgi:eukaryotic-like serine/threonine-protein kinase
VEISNPSARWQKIEELFYAALDVSPEARPDFLRQACGSNLELLQEVQSLIDSSEKTVGGFVRQAVLQVTREQTSALELSGKRVGAYRLVRVIGEGGMGTVYLATRADDTFRHEVAIKLMHPGFGPSQGMLLRFSAERQILANLNHPNIARLLDGGMTADGVPYLVMEYVEGVPITTHCAQNHLSVDGRLELFRMVCGAVEYAHKNLVIHRDIKPANILVTPEGVPKLLDFGIAKLLDSRSGDVKLTQTSERFLTPEHASPEQIRGEPVTTATDVYALGVLLYELLAGRRPFQMAAKSPLEVAQIICEQTPELPSRVVALAAVENAPEISRQLRGDLDHIALMAMRKEPSRRYSSVGALSGDLQAYLTGYSVQARTDTWHYRAAKFLRRHTVAVPLGILALLAVIGFSTGMGLLARRADRQRKIADRQRLAAQQESEFLASIFNAASPVVAQGKPVMARDLLDQGTKRIDSELAATPDVQATMLHNMGEAYGELGLYDQAQPVLERAYNLRKKLFRSPNIDIAKSADVLGTVIRLQGRYAIADPLFHEALQNAQGAPGDNRVAIAHFLSDLGECLYMESKDAEAESLLRQSLALDPNPDAIRGNTSNYLSLVLLRKEDLAEAEQLSEQSIEVFRQSEGPESPSIAIARHNLAAVLREMGNLSAAETAERQNLDFWRRTNPGHSDVAYAMNNLGLILLMKGDWKQAAPFLQEALSIRRKQLGEKHPLVALSIVLWGRELQAKGDYAGAERFLREGLDILRQTSGPENWNVAKVLSYFSSLQLDRADYAGAEGYAQQALDMRRKLGGDNHPDVAASLMDIAVAKELGGDAAGVEPLFRQALEIRKKRLPAGHPAIIQAETRLGEVLTAEGKMATAEPILREAVDSLHHESFPLQAWQIAEAESALGVCLAKLGRLGEAESLLVSSDRPLLVYPEAGLRRWMLRCRKSAQRSAQKDIPSSSRKAVSAVSQPAQ